LDVIFANVWTKDRLSDPEKEAIRGPMAAVIYKHGGSIPVEWQLAAAIGFAAAPRFAKHKAAQAKAKDKYAAGPDAPAATQVVKVS
jgi:hypothetical protein